MSKQNFSKKRQAIYNIISSTKSHPSAEWVYNNLAEEYPDLSLATIYRNIALFKEQGLVVTVGNVNGQDRIDANVKPHSHFICNVCGSVIDVFSINDDKTLDKFIEKNYNFNVTYHNLTFYGECNKCREMNLDNRR